MQTTHISGSADNPYFDYFHYMHAMKMDTDEYFNKEIMKEYQLKHDYYISTQQLAFLEWEYEHRSSYLPYFKKRKKGMWKSMVFADAFAAAVFLACKMITMYIAAPMNSLFNYMYFVIFVLPALITAIKSSLMYFLADGSLKSHALRQHWNVENITQAAAKYECELVHLEAEIQNIRELSDRLYEQALPYLSAANRKFEAADAAVIPVENISAAITETAFLQDQVASKKKQLASETERLRRVQMKKKQKAILHAIGMVAANFLFSLALTPLRDYTVSMFLSIGLYAFCIIPIIVRGVTVIMDYLKKEEQKSILENLSTIDRLENRYLELCEKRSEYEALQMQNADGQTEEYYTYLL